MRNRNRRLVSGILMTPFALWAACGGGGGSSGSGSTGVRESALSEVPFVGQFTAACAGGTALIEGFAPALVIPGSSSDLPTAREVLRSGDPDTIPVIGGIVQLSALVPSDVEGIDADETLAMIPAGGLPGSLPVLGSAPVTCGSLPALDPSDPELAPGLVPVFDPSGVLVGIILATVGGDDDVIDVGVPGGLLPEEFDTTIGTLLELLGPIAPQPTPTPTGSGSQPTPTPTPDPLAGGGVCNDSAGFHCPTGQICLQNPEYPAGWGDCQGISL